MTDEEEPTEEPKKGVEENSSPQASNDIDPAKQKEIDKEAEKYKKKFGKDNFKTGEYKKDAKDAVKDGKNLNAVDAKSYVIDNGPPGGGGGGGGEQSFTGGYKDGKFFAQSPDGKIITADNNYDLNDKLAKAFKEGHGNSDKPLSIDFSASNNLGDVSLEQRKRDFAKAFINNGIIPEGDIPMDKEFWQEFKNEYLSNKENTPEMWEKLTKHIPDDVMGREKQEKTANNQKKTTKDLGKILQQLRGIGQGVPYSYKPPSKINANSLKMLNGGRN